jgi:hypothetical protein
VSVVEILALHFRFVVDQLGRLAGLGFQAAIGAVANVWKVTPLEVIAAEVIPAVASL